MPYTTDPTRIPSYHCSRCNKPTACSTSAREMPHAGSDATPEAHDALGIEPTLSAGVSRRWPTVRVRQVDINDSKVVASCPGPAINALASRAYASSKESGGGSESCGSCGPCASDPSLLWADRLSAIRESARLGAIAA